MYLDISQRNLVDSVRIQVGDAFVICDAGGGTVDLISYEITALSPRLDLKELVTGKGLFTRTRGMVDRRGVVADCCESQVVWQVPLDSTSDLLRPSRIS